MSVPTALCTARACWTRRTTRRCGLVDSLIGLPTAWVYRLCRIERVILAGGFWQMSRLAGESGLGGWAGRAVREGHTTSIDSLGNGSGTGRCVWHRLRRNDRSVRSRKPHRELHHGNCEEGPCRQSPCRQETRCQKARCQETRQAEATCGGEQDNGTEEEACCQEHHRQEVCGSPCRPHGLSVPRCVVRRVAGETTPGSGPRWCAEGWV